MKTQDKILTDCGISSTISNIQYPISNIQYPIALKNRHLLYPQLTNSKYFHSLVLYFFCFFFLFILSVSLFGCAPLDTSDPPATAPVNPVISFSSSAVASSVQLEMSSNVELTNIGAVIRVATEAEPAEAEAKASAGHVSFSIPAGITRKISISQHYGSIFSDGLTLDDVLAPNTAYKLYLYFPADRITTTAELTGLSITNDRAVVPFTTAMLPAAGDAEWLNSNGSKYVASLDTLYFMQEQKGVVVGYFYVNFTPHVAEFSAIDANGILSNIGTYVPSANIVSIGRDFDFAYGTISGYISNATNHYYYWIGTDKVRIIEDRTRHTTSSSKGEDIVTFIPVTRH
ncbi:hypothetical protein P0082_01200 [Candidatus Haliotispira prima]|uniref:Uncharacterized protein n=1 Tax=Candidatus Haliotispira prima TaxID=3034016 RepID=A0ABY8MI43_9SPIO|nr:hypothetical protein P0082_01200 [Candidatus Haliotispira prima]